MDRGARDAGAPVHAFGSVDEGDAESGGDHQTADEGDHERDDHVELLPQRLVHVRPQFGNVLLGGHPLLDGPETGRCQLPQDVDVLLHGDTQDLDVLLRGDTQVLEVLLGGHVGPASRWKVCHQRRRSLLPSVSMRPWCMSYLSCSVSAPQILSLSGGLPYEGEPARFPKRALTPGPVTSISACVEAAMHFHGSAASVGTNDKRPAGALDRARIGHTNFVLAPGFRPYDRDPGARTSKRTRRWRPVKWCRST